MNLRQKITEHIRRRGPLSIADYMQMALAEPEQGYYMARMPFGREGDFITAPDVSQVFGELIGAWCAHAWLSMGQPVIRLVELGPGRGTLMADLLRGTKQVKGFHDALRVELVEMSPGLRKLQEKTLAGAHPRISWAQKFQSSAEPVLLVANEFLDALPVRQFRKIRGAWEERHVGLAKDDTLMFIWQAARKMPEAVLSESAPDGAVLEHAAAAEDYVTAAAKHVAAHGGAGLFIDYGAWDGTGDTLQAVQKHGYVDPLASPGEADITAHVRFAPLARAAKEANAAVHGPVPQGLFLERLGARERAAALSAKATREQKADIAAAMKRLLSPTAMGAHFQVMGVAQPGLPVEGFR